MDESEQWWSEKGFDKLPEDVSLEADEAALSAALRSEQVRQHVQANDLRQKFFWVACSLAIATVATSVFLVVSAVFGASIEPTVAIAFMSGLSVQTVGVLLVMAGYLFPKPPKDS